MYQPYDVSTIFGHYETAWFPAAASWSITAFDDTDWVDGKPLPKSGFPKLHHPGFCGYGDAPFHPLDSQCSGTTMTTDVVRILEFWDRHDHLNPTRRAEYEVYVGEDEAA